MGKGGGIVKSVVGGLGRATGITQPKMKLPKAPEVVKPKGPRQYSRAELLNIGKTARGAASLQGAQSLGLSAEMNDLQKRTAFATQAVSGGLKLDKQSLGVYRGLATGALNDKAGLTDIEKQFINEGLGEKPMGNKTEDYLSAIERAYRKYK